MKCPKCRDAQLTEVQAGPGLAVDLCRACSGAWLDKSEIYRFVRQPQRLYEELGAAFRSVSPSDFSCPRCQKMMLHARLESADIVLEACPGCGGTWFDAGEVEKLQAAVAPAPARGGPGPEGRPLTEMETATVFGSDGVAALAFVLASGGAAAAAAGAVLGAMRKLPIRLLDVGLFVLAVLPAALLLFLWARARGRRRAQARLFRGIVTSVRQLSSGPWGEVELTVRFSHGGADHSVSRRVGYRLFSDVAVGSAVGVVVPVEGPEEAKLVRDS
ncbi:MAG: zf-TFIIB domain-containing protein [Elusimicrobia bacterium]|nr:zf-TFIIB domain-containing protein [Elusimicrobiota bacterium]